MMDLASVHALYDVLAHDRFDLIYSGGFHDEHTADLITLGEDPLVTSGGDRSHRQRLAFVMVEAYQNIVRHRAKLKGAMERGAGRSLFMLRCADAGEEVIALDPVLADETEALDSMLGRIGRADLKQLKELFLDRLKDGTRTQRGGAGLGLIEMARRSNNGLRHRLLPLDANSRLFLLSVLIGQAPKETPADEVMRLHTLVAANDILLMCRGEASPTVLDVVLRLMSKDIMDNATALDRSRRAYLAATEWLQAAGLTGRSFVALSGSYQIALGGCLPHASVPAIKAQVEEVNGLDGNERERRYRNALLGRGAVPSHIGLLDLARTALGPLDVAQFEVIDGTRVIVRARLA